MTRGRSLARRVYEPITRRIDGVIWRLDVLERHRAEDRERYEGSSRLHEDALAATREELLTEVRSGQDAARAEVAAALADLQQRLDAIERRIEAGHESQLESAAYLGRAAREAPAREEPRQGADARG